MEPAECLSYSSVVSEQAKKEKKVIWKKFWILLKKIDYWLTINCMLITIKFVLVLGREVNVSINSFICSLAQVILRSLKLVFGKLLQNDGFQFNLMKHCLFLELGIYYFHNRNNSK